MNNTNIFRTLTILSLILLVATSLSCSSRVVAQEDEEVGVRFTMTMEAPDRDAVEFDGAALGEDFGLTGVVGGIATRTILTGGKLYALTPAIKTAREVDNPPPPARDEDGWAEWLIEPGRINPVTFDARIGLRSDFDGETSLGDTESVAAIFDHGKLASIEFHVPPQEGTISYTYSDYEDDDSITANDFRVPDDYMLPD